MMASMHARSHVVTALVAGCALLAALIPGATQARTEAGAVTISYAHWGDTVEVHGAQVALNAFEKSHPAIKVHLQAADWNTYWTKLPTQMAAGQAPDAFFFDEGYYQTHYAADGRLLELDPLIKRDHIDMNQFWPQELPSFSYHGHFYNLPNDINVGMLAWNKDLFRKAGLKAAPTSWQQVLHDAQILTLDNKGHNAAQRGFDAKHIVQYGFYSYEFLDFIDEPLITEMGGHLWSQPETSANVRCLINTPTARKAIQFLVDLIYKYHVSPTPSEAGHYQNIFMSGKVAMYVDGSWMLANLAQGIHSFKWDVGAFPSWNGVYASSAQGLGNAIYVNSPNKEAAWTLVKWFSSLQGQAVVAKDGNALPASPALAYSKAYLSGKPAGVPTLLKSIKYTVPYLDFPHKADAFNYVDSQLLTVFAGTTSVAAGLKKAADGANAYLQGGHP